MSLRKNVKLKNTRAFFVASVNSKIFSVTISVFDAIKNNILRGRNARFVVVATSYPDRVQDYGDESPILISNTEVKVLLVLAKLSSNLVFTFSFNFSISPFKSTI